MHFFRKSNSISYRSGGFTFEKDVGPEILSACDNFSDAIYLVKAIEIVRQKCLQRT